jgi:hypothetical protein
MMDNTQSAKGAWVTPELRVYGAFEELTQSVSGCKVLGSPGDGYYLFNKNNPLTACPMS